MHTIPIPVTTQSGQAERHNYELLPSWPSICQPIKLNDDYHMSDKLLKALLYNFFPCTVCLFHFPTPYLYFWALPESLSHFPSSFFSSLSSSLTCSFLPSWKRAPKLLVHLGFYLEMSCHRWSYPSQSCTSCILIIIYIKKSVILYHAENRWSRLICLQGCSYS